MDFVICEMMSVAAVREVIAPSVRHVLQLIPCQMGHLDLEFVHLVISW